MYLYLYLERLILVMAYSATTGTLNTTHSLALYFFNAGPKTLYFKQYLVSAGVSAVDIVSRKEQLSRGAVLTNASLRSPSLPPASPETVSPKHKQAS